MLAPERFAAWMNAYRHTDRRFGHTYRYHSRSDAHSVALCTEVLRDLLEACPALRSQAERGEVVYGINTLLTWPSTGESLHISQHRQPAAAAGMIQHLRGLPIREQVGQVGFDAYATIVIETDNIGAARLWTEPPAPQPGDRDHYETFLARLSHFYAE